MSLLAELEGRNGDAPLWILSGGRTVTLNGLRFFLQHYSAFFAGLAGKSVALKSNDQAFLSAFLLGLDGLCEQIFLVPEMTNEDRAAELLAAFQPEYVLEYSCGVVIVCHSAANREFPVEMELLWAGSAARFGGKNQFLLPDLQQETQWVIPTSGTTGRPKLVKHNLKTLARTVNRSQMGQSDFRWGLLYSLSRFAGLQVFLQALLSGSPMILSDHQRTLEQQMSEMISAGCNALSATPTLWRKILMTPQIDLTALRQITLGGEIADQQILTALQSRLPKARITHIYASTEAGVGFSVSDGRAGFPAEYLIGSLDATGIKVSPNGHLLLRPTNPFQEYVGGDRVFDEEGWVNTGDMVTRIGDRYFFLGRENGCINVGGNKVHPEEVEQVLRTFPGILDARVSGKNNPITGHLVVADVIVDGNITLSKEFEKSIITHCRQRLDPYKIPAFVNFVTSFKISVSGKVERG